MRYNDLPQGFASDLVAMMLTYADVMEKRDDLQHTEAACEVIRNMVVAISLVEGLSGTIH